MIRSKFCQIPHLALNQEPAVIRIVVSSYFLYRQGPQVWTRHRGGANDRILELEEHTTQSLPDKTKRPYDTRLASGLLFTP